MIPVKKIIAFCLLLSLLLLCAGCAAKAPAPASTEPQATQGLEPSVPPAAESPSSRSKIVYASTMDEFLKAIGPDTEIILDKSSYNLQDASDYGIGDTAYYSWDYCFDGFELRLHNVSGLTVRGSGMNKTLMETAPRYANVLILQDCSDIQFEDLTFGHVRGLQGECSGGVFKALACEAIDLTGCGFFGCGTVGVITNYCDQITVTDCDIYECSYSAASLTDSRYVTIDGCHIYRIGDELYGGSDIFNAYGCKSVEIQNCEILDSTVYTLLNSSESTRLNIHNNKISDMTFKGGMFSLMGSTGVFDSNTLTGTTVRTWYEGYSATFSDASGSALTENALADLYPDACPVSTVIPEENRKQVHVSTVDDFLAAIDSNTVIILDAPLYDLSTASDYGTSGTSRYTWVDNFDGPALIIDGVHDLAIRSSDNNPANHTIAAIPRYADVLFFRMCSNIDLSGFTAGHTKEPGYCMGGVLHFEQCDNVRVDRCSLFGCGILGVQADYCSGVQVENTEIYECSYGGIQMWNTRDVSIDNCSFRDLGGSRLSFNGCINVTENGTPLYNGYYD